ncbi:unnamed protein product [Clonostachys solani]|uniref:Fucose-specific lectin n=1 Tax=Clonostachys solani TaxID=160281 RepID=A0A9N9ZGW0_9HYPO|nr:unnamed protein product [Clonostachys solani]
MEWPVKNKHLPISPNYGRSDAGLHPVPEPTLEVVAGDRVVYDEGKEVVSSPGAGESTIVSPSSPSDLTSATTPGQAKIKPFDGHYDGHHYHHHGMEDDGKIVVTSSSNDKQPWYRKPIVLAGLIVLAVVIILAAVLGGVFGSRSRNNSSSPDSSSGSTTTTTASAAPSSTATSIAADSPMGVSGWKNGDDNNLYVAYQAADNSLKYSKATASGSQTEFTWGEPKSLKPESTLGKNAGLTMSVSVDQSNDANSQIQLSLLYVNETSYINGLTYVTGGQAEAKGFTTSDINQQPFKVAENSTLSAYWPFMLYQNTSGVVHALWYESETPYVPYSLSATAASKSNLAVVPVSRNVTKISGKGFWAIFYQNQNGKIVATPDPGFWDEKRADDLVTIVSTWNSTFPDITLAIGSSFTAFSLARGDNDKVNTFLLYQDGSDIKQAWINNDNGWQISSPKLLQGADRGTHIGCITPAVWKSDRTFSEKLLAEESDLSKCYFQKGGKLFEVRLEGKDWVDLKEISIP